LVVVFRVFGAFLSTMAFILDSPEFNSLVCGDVRGGFDRGNDPSMGLFTQTRRLEHLLRRNVCNASPCSTGCSIA
jgi:hypothetical protein